jgi:hypothetical protein
MPISNTSHPKFTQMREAAKRQPDFQQLYFCFETGKLFGPYLFEHHRHSEENMLDDFGGLYAEQKAKNATAYGKAGGMHGHGVALVFIYTVNSPCGEPDHNCAKLLLNLPNHFPINGKYQLGYSRIWDGLPRNDQKIRAEIKARSEAGLANIVASDNWMVRQVG